MLNEVNEKKNNNKYNNGIKIKANQTHAKAQQQFIGIITEEEINNIRTGERPRNLALENLPTGANNRKRRQITDTNSNNDETWPLKVDNDGQYW